MTGLRILDSHLNAAGLREHAKDAVDVNAGCHIATDSAMHAPACLAIERV